MAAAIRLKNIFRIINLKSFLQGQQLNYHPLSDVIMEVSSGIPGKISPPSIRSVIPVI